MDFDFGLGLVIAFLVGMLVSAYYFEGRIRALEARVGAVGQ